MQKHAIATYGAIDVVFPNAGVGETGKWLEDEVTSNGDPAVRLRAVQRGSSANEVAQD